MDLEALWTYRPPTDETTPKYQAIRSAEMEIRRLAGRIHEGEWVPFDLIREATLDYARTIERLAPDCIDRTVALDSCRVVRMALNELQVSRSRANDGAHEDRCYDIAVKQALSARWYACSAIALNGEY